MSITRYLACLSLTLSLSLAGCAATRSNTQTEVPAMHSISEFKDQRFADVADPWEGFNRSRN
jgi:ABC-type transporter lipoprotein component MlaA